MSDTSRLYRGYTVLIRTSTLPSRSINSSHLDVLNGKREVFLDGLDISKDVRHSGQIFLEDTFIATQKYVDEQIRKEFLPEKD